MANVKFSQIVGAGAISKSTDTLIGVQSSATDVQYVISDVLKLAANTLGASNLGNTVGTSGVVSGNVELVLAGGNNVTLSQSINGSSATITISGANAPAQTNQSGGVYASSNTFGTSSGTFDARSLSIAGSGAVNVAASNSGWVISSPIQSNQQLSMYAVSNTTLSTSSTGNASALSFQGAGGVSVGISGGSVIISGGAGGGLSSASVFAVSNTTLSTSHTVALSAFSLAGAGVVSVGVSNGSIQISAPAAAADGVNIISVSGNTAGVLTTFSTGSIVLAGGNNVTLSQTSNSITISGPNFTTITQGNMVTISSAGSSATVDAFANILSASGNTVGTLATFSSGTMVLAGGNNITLSQSSNTITIVGGGGGGTLSMFAVSNTTQSTSGSVAETALSFNGAGAVSVGISGKSVVISSPVQSNQSLALFAGSNTTVSTSGTVDARSVSIAGAGAISVEASNSGWTVSGPALTQLVAGNNISLSSAGSTVSIIGLYSAGAISQYEPWQFGANTSASSLGVSSLYFQHFEAPEMQVCRVDRLISLSINAAVSGSTLATGTRSNVWTYNETVGLYTRGTGTNSTNLYSYMSNSWSFGITESVSIFTTQNALTAGLAQSYTLGFPANIDTNGGVTTSTFSSASSTQSAGVTVSQANQISNVSGLLRLDVPFGSTLLSGGDYWLAIVGRTATTTGGTSTNNGSISNIVLTNFNAGLQRLGQTATATSNTLIAGNGVFSAQTSQFPSSVAINAISNNSNVSLYGNFMNLSL